MCVHSIYLNSLTNLTVLFGDSKPVPFRCCNRRPTYVDNQPKLEDVSNKFHSISTGSCYNFAKGKINLFSLSALGQWGSLTLPILFVDREESQGSSVLLGGQWCISQHWQLSVQNFEASGILNCLFLNRSMCYFFLQFFSLSSKTDYLPFKYLQLTSG